MAQCIVYARVSTRQQAWGHGIVRQIECCQQQAKSDKAFVRSVYVDVCSGTGTMPNRERAIEESKATGYPIYVEAVDRWTRQADDASLNDEEGVDLVICGEAQQGLAEVLRLLLP
jgi:DNA invertase Pin-like site-specific DNA recombinase